VCLDSKSRLAHQQKQDPLKHWHLNGLF
jgi:hypothetical protein